MPRSVTLQEWLECRDLPLEKCNGYRTRHGFPPFQRQADGTLTEAEWTPGMPARGVGDLIAKATSAIGIKPCGGCKQRQSALNRFLPFAIRDDETPVFVSTAQLMQDAAILASRLPDDTAHIIGVARSGLCVAAMVAMLLHRPLSILRHSFRDVIPAGHGWRLTGETGPDGGRVVVIDDTVMTGNSFRDNLPVVTSVYPGALSAAIYVNPAASIKPDIWVHDLKWPHLLEWNLFNSVLSQQLSCDFDGILCHDCPPGDDDDGPRYARFLATARPLYLPRRTTLPLIVTARLEKYRQQTEDWLRRHNVTVDRLVMGPWATLAERSQADIAEFKAKHFAEFQKEKHTVRPPLFIESDPGLAQRIARAAKGVVVCPAVGKCFA